MKKFFVWGGSIFLFFCVLGCVLFFLFFDIVPSHVPEPKSEISTEVDDAAMGSVLIDDVEEMLLQNPHYYPLRALQGAASNTKYIFLLNTTCTQASELIADLTKVIRRHTDAPVRCTDPA